jgi:hypothetical protein
LSEPFDKLRTGLASWAALRYLRQHD